MISLVLYTVLAQFCSQLQNRSQAPTDYIYCTTNQKTGPYLGYIHFYTTETAHRNNNISFAKRLKGIVKYGVGIDVIDIEAAPARNIPVVNIPDYAEETVADRAFAMMSALAKNTIPIYKTMQKRAWLHPEPQWLASDRVGKSRDPRLRVKTHNVHFELCMINSKLQVPPVLKAMSTIPLIKGSGRKVISMNTVEHFSIEMQPALSISLYQ